MPYVHKTFVGTICSTNESLFIIFSCDERRRWGLQLIFYRYQILFSDVKRSTIVDFSLIFYWFVLKEILRRNFAWWSQEDENVTTTGRIPCSETKTSLPKGKLVLNCFLWLIRNRRWYIFTKRFWFSFHFRRVMEIRYCARLVDIIALGKAKLHLFRRSPNIS